jgi:acetyl-CoA carboxylase biotin carboxylase subunit
VAEGQPLRYRQDQVSFNGHAIECRLNAEDWTRDFRPDPGTVTGAVFPAGDGIRVDTHIQPGAIVPPYYDSLLAKLIVHGRDRAEAVARARRALAHCEISGVATNVPLHAELFGQEDFAAGAVDTAWLPRFLENHEATGVARG